LWALKPLVEYTVAKARAGQLSARELSNIAHGAAAHRIKDESIDVLFRALARAVQQRVNVFSPQELANTAWAFATVNLVDEKLFRTLAREAERRVSMFNAQELANMAWAFARVSV